ncbi:MULTISPECIES: hypothetical protein [unclassified Pseudofrankia]|uniref:hypothetical protein n=1 Tax=unclassified Pseudofrankia TaxID=2994372 RepID=UPI00090F7AFF|nr:MULTISPECIES: hypothetical protein [unclassified Pseudofrankia]MDT3438202.1 hypothetical protein [Pseudofrankia sp. BMG5.37]OHV46698.1 hypothetical protein BCD48_20675 [Pseudofrankia sp. BMG5.36]
MSEAGAKQWDERVELSEERAELLPDRTTLAAIGIGGRELAPASVPVGSPTSSNFPIGSPSSNNSIVNTTSAPEVTGGFMPVLITLMPSINFIVQKSDLDSLGVGHDSGDGHVDDAPVNDGHVDDAPVNEGHTDPPADDKNMNDSPVGDGHTDDPYAGGGGWMDFLRKLFGG